MLVLFDVSMLRFFKCWRLLVIKDESSFTWLVMSFRLRIQYTGLHLDHPAQLL